MKEKQKKKSKDLIPDDLKSIIKNAVYRYRQILGFGQFVGDIIYMKEDVGEEGHECRGAVMAAATIDHRYLKADFKIYPQMIEAWNTKRFTKKDVQEIVAHEVGHLATHQLHYLATSVFKDEGETRDAWEGLTTVIGRLIDEIDEHRNKINKKL